MRQAPIAVFYPGCDLILRRLNGLAEVRLSFIARLKRLPLLFPLSIGVDFMVHLHMGVMRMRCIDDATGKHSQ